MGFQMFPHFFSCCVTGFCKRQFSTQKCSMDFYTLSSSQKCSSGYCSIGIVPQMWLANMQLKTIQMQMSEKPCNSNSIILLFTQFRCLRFIKNTKEVPFFFKYMLFLSVFQAFGSTSFDLLYETITENVTLVKSCELQCLGCFRPNSSWW